MSSPPETFLASLITLSRKQIGQAGSRYTPGIDPDAPNIKIERLFAAIENVVCGAGAHARFQSVLDEFSKEWKLAKHYSQRPNTLQRRVNKARKFLSPMMKRLRMGEAAAGEEWSSLLTKIESDLMKDIEHWRLEEDKPKLTERDTGYSSTHNPISEKINAIARCLTIVHEEKEYIHRLEFKLLHDPNLLIKGEWGTGKTHLLCDVAQNRINHCQATVLVLAKNFKSNVVCEICSQIDKECTVAEIFNRLEELANKTEERAIFILDGINEGSRQEWLEAVTTLQSLVANRRNIGLIVSCRTPFESIAIKHEDLEKFHKVDHIGFDDQGFEAQEEFFRYYDLPLPEVPLLDREFSRPLTLKLIGESLKNLTVKKRARGFAGIASGQKGMTYVLESFVDCVGETIEHQYSLGSNGCWQLLKGSDRIVDRKYAGFAPCMAENLRDYVNRTEADRIIAANYPKLKPAQRCKLLDALRTNGLINEDVVWYSAKTERKFRVIFRLPYQRFSDHLIARHLLSKHLNASSVKAIKQSFEGRSSLARIFQTSNKNSREYAKPGLAQALITEFPERVKKQLPSKQRELFFVLPKRARCLNAYSGPFIEGVFWRAPEAFTEGTHVIIKKYLNSGSRAWWQMVDALAAVSTKPKHPYQARRLYEFLASYSMSDRDLQWSEYLRRRYALFTIGRLLAWAENLNVANLEQRSAENIVVLLSLVLTTVARSDRDLATKALVLIGERFPEVLFTHVVTTLGFNDPYVPERMLAAAYGTTLSLVDSEEAPTFRPLLGKLAKSLYQMMFGPEAGNATHHTLMRDYALGIIEIAQCAKCVSLPKTASRGIVAPFPNTPSTFVSDGTPDPSVKKSIGHSIEMDFKNYTIGRLIPNRGNYDYDNSDYVQVCAKIERRMFDLGYREERFKDADDRIRSKSIYMRNQDKVDRYGKKYSWIAYFEMWGEREAVKKLPDQRLGGRTSDCGVDPSFPKRPPCWTPPIPNLFGDMDATTEAWVEGGYTPDWRSLLSVPEINGHQGEWLLLQGFVYGIDEGHDREIFAFLRGMFIARKDICSLRTKFFEVDFPGNGNLPEGATENNIYAGEAGRRQNYARHLYRRNIGYRRQILKAFEPFDSYFRTHPKGKGSDASFTGICLEIPYIEFSGESHHSSQNDFLIFNLPAPSLIQRFGLSSKNREIDFYDSMGKPGTLFREAGGQNEDRHSLLYIRADLLRRYLKETRQVLVWCNWGERNWLKKMEGYEVISDPARDRIYQSKDHIHRSFYQWSAKDGGIV